MFLWRCAGTRRRDQAPTIPNACEYEITYGFQANLIIDDWIGLSNSERSHAAACLTRYYPNW